MKRFVPLLLLAVALSAPVSGNDLNRAIRQEERAALKILLDEGADINALDESGRSPLETALFFGKREAASDLIRRGARVVPQTEGGLENLLFVAIFTGNTKHTARLINHGADPDFRTPGGLTPLLTALLYGREPRMLDLLITAGADLRRAVPSGYSPLAAAAAFNPLSAITERLIEYGFSPDTMSADGITPLGAAVLKNGNPRVTEVLLRAGGTPEKALREGRLDQEIRREGVSEVIINLVFPEGLSESIEQEDEERQEEAPSGS